MMKRWTIRATLLLFIGLLSGCQWALPSADNSLTFNIVFKDAQGLTVGSPLIFQGVTIGAVIDVTVMAVQATSPPGSCQLDNIIELVNQPQVACLTITVAETNRHLVRGESNFLIRSSASATTLNQKHIEMTVWNSESPELPDNITIIGSENLLDFYWKRVQRWEQGLTLGELTLSTEIEADGAVKRAYLLETNSYLPVESILDELLPLGETGWEVSRPLQEDTKLLRVSRDFSSATAVTSNNSEVILETNNSILGAEYVYTETFQPGQFVGNQGFITIAEWGDLLTNWYKRLSAGREDSAGLVFEAVATLFDQIQTGLTGVLPLSRVAVVVTVKMPGEIVAEESNAHFVLGNEASWLLTLEDLNNGFSVRAVARQTRLSCGGAGASCGWLIGGVLLVILASLVGIYILYKMRQADAKLAALNNDDPSDLYHNDDPFDLDNDAPFYDPDSGFDEAE